jgi:hypothetical protein
MNRRNFLTRSGAALALAPLAGSAALFTTTGCSTSWINTAIADIPTAIAIAQSISAIVTLATGNALITPAAAALIETAASVAKAGLLTLQDAINTYQKNPSTTTLAKITDTLNQLLTDLPNILPTLTFTDQATKVAITTGITLLISVLSSIQLLIPAPVIAAGTRSASRNLSSARVILANKNAKIVVPSVDQIKSQFNSVVALNGYADVAIN